MDDSIYYFWYFAAVAMAVFALAVQTETGHGIVPSIGMRFPAKRRISGLIRGSLPVFTGKPGEVRKRIIC